MGNNNSRNDLSAADVDPANAIDDFEPIDKPASPTFMSAFQKPFNPNDLATSGVWSASGQWTFPKRTGP